MTFYNIKQFSELINVSKQTLRNWDKEGKLTPVKLKSGHRRYTEEHFKIFNKSFKNNERLNIIYCRESTKQQLNSLNNQINKCKDFCINNGIKVDKVISDNLSALNYNRNGLKELLKLSIENKIENLIIYYKDRLVRFGFEMFEELSKINNFKIIIIDNSETDKSKESEFAEDLISIIHHFSMKIYGKRSYKKKVLLAESNINEIKNEIL
jgi:predicted site-specific integrase-resolvase